LFAVAAGIVIQILPGIDFPVIPPGLVGTIAAAAVVVLLRRRWAPAVGVPVAIWLLVGFLVNGTTPRLVGPLPTGALAGLWVPGHRAAHGRRGGRCRMVW